MSILIVSNHSDLPTNEIIEIINGKGHHVIRLNTEELCAGISMMIGIENSIFMPILSYGARTINLCDLKSAFYWRPQKPSHSHIKDAEAREFAEAECSIFMSWIWQTFPCFWVNQPSLIRRAESKIDQLRIAPSLGFNIPKTLITNQPDAIREFYRKCNGDIVNKVLAKGVVKINDATYAIYTHRVEKRHMDNLDSVTNTPCLFQERIEKAFELRITVVGDQVFAAEIHSQMNARTKDDWRKYDFEHTPHKIHHLPRDVKASCLGLLAHYGLHFGAIDMIVTPEGKYVFLEINPNGQWLWIERLTGMPISEAIADMLIRASV